MASDTKHVLIVEDEKALAHALELKLQSAGWQTTIARNGKDALVCIGQEVYDVMLIDLMMPEMDGFQVLAELQNAPNKPKTIFVLSNLSQPEDEQRVIALGAKKFFVKAETSLSTIIDEVNRA